MCFPAQIEIFTDSENSNRTNNPRKDSNIFVVLSFTSNGKMKLFTVALILCLQASSLLGGKRKHLNILLIHSSKIFSILLCKFSFIFRRIRSSNVFLSMIYFVVPKPSPDSKFAITRGKIDYYINHNLVKGKFKTLFEM